MQTPNLKNIHAVVVGLGLTGNACVHFLNHQGALVTAMDTRLDAIAPKGAKAKLGDFDAATLCSADLVVLSPGVNPNHPSIQAAYKDNVDVVGDVELFARFNRTPVIAITGSNGKSTVTCLITDILKSAGINAVMGGNIGKPVLELLDIEADVFVLELSSFQLETTRSLKPVCATILNISEDHLDRHITLDAYVAAKKRIYRKAQNKVANRDDVLTWPKKYNTKTSFGLSASPVGLSWDAENRQILDNNQPLISEQDCALRGAHNVLNMQAAISCVRPFNVDDNSIRNALRSFSGLAHRFQLISQANNVRWINDSKATNIGATIAAIQSLQDRAGGKLVLIAGGDGKNANFTELQPILLDSVDLLITMGKDGRVIASLKPGSIEVSDMREAVDFANNIVESGDVVLLSPACASIDMYDNYQVRGEAFKNEVLKVVS